jgi:hypothetical protein
MARGGDGGGVRRFQRSHRSLYGGGGGPDSLGFRNGRRRQGDGELWGGPSSCSWSNAKRADQPVDAAYDGRLCSGGALRRAVSIPSRVHAPRRLMRI